MLLLFEGGEAWTITFPTFVAIVGFIVLIASSVIIIMSKRREDVHLIETKRANSNADLVKTRDLEIKDLEDKLTDKGDDYESMSREYKTLAAIDIDELMTYWATYQQQKTDRENLEDENARMKRRLKIYEDEDAGVRPAIKRK